MAQVRRPHGAVAHFAINADNIALSQKFYETLFGWTFHSWGPPGFFQIETPAAPPILAAMQGRRELLPGVKTVGFECTIAVDDVRAIVEAANQLGGRTVMEPTIIPTVCELAFIEDPGGNVVGLAQYDR